MAHAACLLTREELWVLARTLGGGAFPGIPFDDLDARPQEARQALQDLLERILWARGIVARDQNGRIHVRRGIWELLHTGLFPGTVYFYGQRHANGQEDVVFFYQNDRQLVACAQLVPSVYQFTALPDPEWMIRIVGTGMELPRYELPPPQSPGIELPKEVLQALSQRIQQAPHEDEAHRFWVQAQGAKVPEETWRYLLETLRDIHTYHALARVPYPEVQNQRGFAFLQSPRFLWYIEPKAEKRYLQLVDASFALQRLKSLFLVSAS